MEMDSSHIQDVLVICGKISNIFSNMQKNTRFYLLNAADQLF